jgi:hypothetical protein
MSAAVSGGSEIPPNNPAWRAASTVATDSSMSRIGTIATPACRAGWLEQNSANHRLYTVGPRLRSSADAAYSMPPPGVATAGYGANGTDPCGNITSPAIPSESRYRWRVSGSDSPAANSRSRTVAPPEADLDRALAASGVLRRSYSSMHARYSSKSSSQRDSKYGRNASIREGPAWQSAEMTSVATAPPRPRVIECPVSPIDVAIGPPVDRSLRAERGSATGR